MTQIKYTLFPWQIRGRQINQGRNNPAPGTLPGPQAVAEYTDYTQIQLHVAYCSGHHVQKPDKDMLKPYMHNFQSISLLEHPCTLPKPIWGMETAEDKR